MKIFCDTSVIVEIDRGNKETTEILNKAIRVGHELLISTITVAEIFTGSYLSNTKEAILNAKEVLSQFIWQDVDAAAAEIAGKLYAHILIEKKQNEIEYQDIIIAATCLSTRADILLTLNKKDFILLPGIRERARTPAEFHDEHRD